MPAMTANEFGDMVTDLTAAFFLLGMLSVVAGLWLHAACGWLVDRLLETGPFRRLLHRRWLKKHGFEVAPMTPSPTGVATSDPLRARGQSGRASFAVLFWLSAVVVASLAACSAPIHYADDHAIWLEQVKKKGW